MAMFFVNGINLHHWSIKKPLGGRSSVIRRTASHPLPAIVGGLTGGAGLGVLGGVAAGAGLNDLHQAGVTARNEYNNENARLAAGDAANTSDLNSLAAQEEAKRHALGIQQQGQINTFADQTAASGKTFRDSLAASLASTAGDRFNQLNPGILEDLNSRGLFTSQTARDKSQADALKSIALEDQGVLSGVDQSNFNNVQDIRGTGLSAMLGGDQSALDSALSLRKASIQHQFDQQSQQAQMNLASRLAGQQQRSQLLGSLLGLGGSLGAGLLGGL